MKNNNEDFDLTAEEMRSVLRQELANIAKAQELRSREIKDMLRDSISGKNSPQQTLDRHSEYEMRWGESLPGTKALPGMTNDEIMTDIANARKKDAPMSTWLKRSLKIDSPKER